MTRVAVVRGEGQVREELGIEPPVGRLLVADWWDDNIDGIPGAKVLLSSTAGELPQAQLARIRPGGHEVTGHSFHPVEQLASVTITRLANRIEHAVAARPDGTTRYLEAGHPIGDASPGRPP